MKNKKWELIHELYVRMEQLCGKSLYQPEELLLGGASPQKKTAGEENQPQKEYSIEDMIALRAELRNQLDFLKVALSDVHNERDTYMILFPIVAQIDEIIQNNILSPVDVSWPLLQKELFQIENAGEVFYEILEDLLNKPQTPTSIYEVYYFCLRYGFRGRYENNPAKIVDYINRLREKLEVHGEKDIPLEAESTGQVKKIIRPYWYYLIAAGVFLLVFLMLFLVAENI
ncbi:MAG: DotU family type IV/VI secretion system protein [Smithella sp.]